MNKVKTAFRAFALIATAIFLLASPAHAQDEAQDDVEDYEEKPSYEILQYVGLDIDDGADEYSTPALMLSLGTRFNSIFAIEGRVGIGVGDDSINSAGEEIATLEIDSYYGVFVRLGVPKMGWFYPYIIAGYGIMDIGTDIGDGIDADVSISGSSVATGIGINFNFSDSFSGNIEYMNYYDDEADIVLDQNIAEGDPGYLLGSVDNIEVSGVAFGLMYKF